MYVWSVPVESTALAFLNSSALGKGYQDDLFVGNINNGSIFHFELNDQMNCFVLEDPLDDKVADNPYENNDLIFASGFGGITGIQGGLMASCMYVLSFHNSEGAIYRIVPSK